MNQAKIQKFVVGKLYIHLLIFQPRLIRCSWNLKSRLSTHIQNRNNVHVYDKYPEYLLLRDCLTRCAISFLKKLSEFLGEKLQIV